MGVLAFRASTGHFARPGRIRRVRVIVDVDRPPAAAYDGGNPRGGTPVNTTRDDDFPDAPGGPGHPAADLRHVLALMKAGRWDEAHDLVQRDASELGARLHGLLHLQEGDLENAEYWFLRANRHFRSRGTLDEELAAFEVALDLRGAAAP
jgi:hypothetical protein